MAHIYSYQRYSVNWQVGQRLGKENSGDETPITQFMGKRKIGTKLKFTISSQKICQNLFLLAHVKDYYNESNSVLQVRVNPHNKEYDHIIIYLERGWYDRFCLLEGDLLLILLLVLLLLLLLLALLLLLLELLVLLLL